MVHVLARIFEGTRGPLIGPTLDSNMLFDAFLDQKSLLLPVLGDLVVLLFFGRGKCGPLIDPTKGNMWTTY